MLDNEILDYFPDGFQPTKFDKDTDIVLMRSFWDKKEIIEAAKVLNLNNILFAIEINEANNSSITKFSPGSMDLFIKEEDLDKARPIMEKFDMDYYLETSENQESPQSSIPLFIRVILFMVLLTLLIVRCFTIMAY